MYTLPVGKMTQNHSNRGRLAILSNRGRHRTTATFCFARRSNLSSRVMMMLMVVFMVVVVVLLSIVAVVTVVVVMVVTAAFQ